jgi:hypothetical protein
VVCEGRIDENHMSDLELAVEGNVVSYKWQDWVNLAHAVWVFGSPWWLHFARIGAARWSHWVVGIVVGLVAVISVPRAKIWKEAIITVAGGWLFLSPWLLGFASAPDARWNAWMFGALFIYVAAWAMTDLIRLSHPPRR